jgi:hypothetical protein
VSGRRRHKKTSKRLCDTEGTSNGTCQGPPSLPPETRLSPFCFVGHVESEIRGFSTASGSKPSPTHPQSNSNVGRWIGGGWEHLGGDEDPSVTLDRSSLIFVRKPTNRPGGGYDDGYQRLSSAQYKATWHRIHKERSDTRILCSFTQSNPNRPRPTPTPVRLVVRNAAQGPE